MNHHFLSSLLVLLSVEYLGVLLAVLADLVSGLRRARRENRPCSSRGFRRVACLSVVDAMIITAIVTLDELGRASLPPYPYLSTLGALSLALIEARSIAENSPHSTDIFNALKLLSQLFRMKR